jgi:hypothetical protein
MKKVKMLTSIIYPSRGSVRNRIRAGDAVSAEEREPLTEVQEGAIVSPPADLLDSWIAQGYAVEVAE